MRLTDATVPEAVARGADLLVGTFNYLDLTPLGRQEDWEEPSGRSGGPFMHWVRRHDRCAPDAAPFGSAACCGERV